MELAPDFRPSAVPVDVVVLERAVVVRADLPGVARASLRVLVQGGRLLIRGERAAPGEAEAARPHLLEIAYGPFERRVDVPVSFDPARVAATLEDGVLRVELARPEPRRIAVKEG